MLSSMNPSGERQHGERLGSPSDAVERHEIARTVRRPTEARCSRFRC